MKLCNILLLLVALSVPALHAEELLFIGNSFTYAQGDAQVMKFGGIPKLVAAIAAAKGKTAGTMMVTTGGKDWKFHLANPATDTALKSKPWNWVVIQDQSTKATHLAEKGAFMEDGAAFYDRIAQESPASGIVLYETWAYDAKSPLYAGKSGSKGFDNPGEMTREIVKSNTALLAALQKKDPNRKVVLAPVGEAFARSVKENPEISLCNAQDFKHPTMEGSYLSALVIYATIYQDSPAGATADFKDFALDAKTAAKLQAVAAAVTAK